MSALTWPEPPGGRMLAGARELPPWLVTPYVRRHAAARGAADATILLQDYDQLLLVPIGEPRDATASDGLAAHAVEAQAIEGTLAGRCFMATTPVERTDEGRRWVYLPLVDGGDRVGVLVLEVGEEAAFARHDWIEFAALVTALLVSKGAHTDVYFQARRRREMTLAAEMQWHLLPPLTVLDPRLALTGLVEPAYEVGGDAFDYAINDDTAHLAVFDAMGHGLDAAVMCAVAVGAYRHGRRSGIPVEDLYALIDGEFAREFGGDRFVTAQLATLDLSTGALCLVNAGHPPPLHIRGHRVVGPVTGPTTLPVGLNGPAPDVIVRQLEPGDLLLLYTDGVVEARRDGVTYGDERLAGDLEHVLGSGLPISEMLRRLNGRLAEWRGGPPEDDATLVLSQWRTRELPPLP